jgi:predicted ATPase
MKQFQSFGLDTSNQCLLHDGGRIDLAPKPFAVLRYLVENPGRLITHDELLDALWPETYVQPQVLRTYMLELRKVLGDDAACPRFIQTLPKRGYRFVAPVTESEDPVVKAPAASPAAAQPERAACIVGRAHELETLNQQVRQTAGGERRIVFINGEAGIGKTALVDAFCRQLDPAIDAIVARGQCVQGVGSTEDYYPVSEGLAQLCSGPQGEEARRVLGRLAPGWLSQGTEHETSARPAAQERHLGDLCGALEELAALRTIVILFEDLHWGDESTLNLISALARRRAPARLMVLATFCPRVGAIDDSLKALKQDLLVRRLCLDMALAPLRKNAVKELLSRELGQDSLPAGLSDFVFHRSEGNPLFVIAVVEHLIAEGVLIREGENGAAEWKQREPFPEQEAGVPGQLARTIELVIERLGEEEQRLLEAASLMPVAFPAWAVAAALEKDLAETEEACDTLARRLHFVVRAGQDELPDGTKSAFYVFAHGLYRDVLYMRQASARRARRHVRIADRLGQLFTGREASVARERAMHYEAAGNRDRAASVLQEAAVQAPPIAVY